jgi:hypothetical protein
MNTILDTYDYTDASGNTLAWEDWEFPSAVPLPLVGETLYLPKDPDKLGLQESVPYRVIGRSFYLQRSRTDATPEMRVCLMVERFEEAEYSS